MAAENLGLLVEPAVQTALLCSVLANIHRGKDSKTFTVDDFLLKVRDTQASAEQLLAGFHQRRGSNR